MSKNNFWWVKAFKYNGLGSQLIDNVYVNPMTCVKNMTTPSKNRRT